eukprot:TRINITY_DN111796_c0_g1_i1.p1 TRINITY_DN111796_c0_g1~~TRINITY_DN111796_c0_g1_i1.p1  ORF type:complete len:278 (+),score=47.21 TRINITY_DN111796_c0_g1_i1:57-890(+)
MPNSYLKPRRLLRPGVLGLALCVAGVCWLWRSALVTCTDGSNVDERRQQRLQQVLHHSEQDAAFALIAGKSRYKTPRGLYGGRELGAAPQAAASTPGAENRRRTVEDMEVGDYIRGVVRHRWFPAGYFIDIGADVSGFLEVGEFRNGFPLGWPYRINQTVAVRVLEKTLDGRIFLTMRSGPLDRPDKMAGRQFGDVTPFREVPEKEWLEAEVVDMSTFAVFVKVDSPLGGEAVKGMVHKSQFKKGFADYVAFGDKVRVRVSQVDEERGHISFSMLQS